MCARLSKRVLWLALLLAALSAGVLSTSTAHNAYADKPLGDKVLEQVAKEQGLALDRLQLGILEPAALPVTGKTLYRAKVIDKETGKVFGVAVDANGMSHDWDKAKQAERAAYLAKYGKLHPALYDRLQKMADTETLTVGMWLKTADLPVTTRAPVYPAALQEGNAPLPPTDVGPPPGTGVPKDVPPERVNTARVAAIQTEQAAQAAAVDAERMSQGNLLKQRIAASEQPLIRDLMAGGRSPVYVSPLAPLVYVTLPKSEIVRLSKRADVDTVYGPNQNRDLMDSARPTQKANTVNAFGFTGTGIRVALVEDSRVETNNPNLAVVNTRIPGDPNVDTHATATAGIVASHHPTYTGIAPGASLYSANATTYTDANLSAAMDWAVYNQSVNVINNSWGGNADNTDLNVHDRHLDYIVRYIWPTVTVAAGNEDNGCGTGTGRVTSPGRGFNVITVGNYADDNTSTWAGDAMDSCSSYVNPSTYVEKPEVAAVGNNINSTTAASPWTGNVGSGTSYAAPMVAGEAALLMSRDHDLNARPEAVKAVILASALHNIEGASALSARDGAGGVDMQAAFHIVDYHMWGWEEVYPTSFPVTHGFHADAGELVRIAIAFDSAPAADYSTDPLLEDLDLYIHRSNNAQVAYSNSSYNAYEVVEFTAPVTDNYHLEVTNYQFNGTKNYLGYAMWTGHRALSPSVPESFGTPPPGRDYYRFDSSIYWNAVGIRPASPADHDMVLYSGSAFGDPASHLSKAGSNYAGSDVDFVVMDGNHIAPAPYYVEVYNYDGTGNYAIQWAVHTADTVGSYGPYTMTTSSVLRVWDVWMPNGQRKYIGIKPVSGNIDFAARLFKSDAGNSSTFYQGKVQAVASSDSSGAAGSEFLSYQATASDWLGLVVWNKAGTLASTYYVYTDFTAPSAGSIVINSGATYATSQSVSLALSATDPETGIGWMRFSNNGTDWSAWENYATTKAWTLAGGDGTKTVYVKYKNNAGMDSAAYTDTIILETTAPTVNISSPSFSEVRSFTVVWTGTDSGSGVASYDVQYKVDDGGTWTPWLTGTAITSQIFGPIDPVTVERGHTYYFRVRGTDNAGNTGVFPGRNGQSSTFVIGDLFLPILNK